MTLGATGWKDTSSAIVTPASSKSIQLHIHANEKGENIPMVPSSQFLARSQAGKVLHLVCTSHPVDFQGSKFSCRQYLSYNKGYSLELNHSTANEEEFSAGCSFHAS
ncbi:hypothetical protein Y1Q_0002403 [Alligator mississippiensis]|uniref:Uncharacterized protein n=1 Tax=Alligator mississippiensis TaxID=8496 RepID=A0A151N699_ALLMI|nr:hypothetical protein Y1Q_0002403 [Alligator mississippiensis]